MFLFVSVFVPLAGLMLATFSLTREEPLEQRIGRAALAVSAISLVAWTLAIYVYFFA